MDLQNIARKYLNMLPGGDEMDLPRIVIVNQISQNWDATAMWDPKLPVPGSILLQKRIMRDTETVERLMAHEICHYWAHTRLYVNKEGNRATHLGHGSGSFWYEAAQIINGKKGDSEFITEFSDASYVSKNTKFFYVMVLKGRSELGWVWFSRLTKNISTQIQNLMLSRPVAIIKTDRDVFLSSYAKLPRIAITLDVAEKALLEEVYTKYAKSYEPGVDLSEVLATAPTFS